MRLVPFKQVDVFTVRAFAGNPVAVVLDADDLDTAQMQQIANWTNLSETAFVLTPTVPEASYRVRIFTPRQELPFAGHPSVGTAHAVLEAGMARPKNGALLQECAAGLLPVTLQPIDGQLRISIRAPDTRMHPVVDGDADRLGAALGRTPLSDPAPQIVYAGPLWWVAEFADAADVRALQPDMSALAALTLSRDAVGVAVFGPERDGDAAIAVRCFCPADGIPEDPVTGSGNAAIAAFLRAHGRLPSGQWIASQGREVGRDGRIAMQVDGDAITLGGHAVTVIDGMMRLA